MRVSFFRGCTLAVALALGVVALATAQSAPDTARVAAWHEDLRVAVDSFLVRDHSFTPETRAAFRTAIASLDATLSTKTDPEIIVALARAVALSGNAHTRAYLVRNRTALRRYPVRVWWFRDRLHVVKALPEHADLLGARVVRIAGRDPIELRREAASIFAGNAAWVDYMTTYSLTCPDLLAGLGVIDPAGVATFELVDRSGTRQERRIDPSPLVLSNQPTEAWWDLSPLHPGVVMASPWMSPLPADAAQLPLYLRRPEERYWAEALPSDGAYYIQYNRSGNAPNGETFAGFAARTLQTLDAARPSKVIVDLRFNTGGNLEVAEGFCRDLAALYWIRGRLFVLVGRATFSAGIYHAAQLVALAHPIVAGEPVGDVLDFWSEGGNILLPHSRLTLHYTNGFHSYSPRPHPGVEPVWRDLDIESLAPDVRVSLTADDWLGGRDPVLESVLRRR